MSQLGNAYRLQINTGTTQSPTWTNIGSEVSLSFDGTSDKIEVANKDVGKHKVYKKLRLDTTIAVTAQEDPTATYGFPDVHALYRQNNTDAGAGIKEFRLNTAVAGEDVIAFTAFVESCSLPAEDQGLITYTFNLQLVTLPTLTAVS